MWLNRHVPFFFYQTLKCVVCKSINIVQFSYLIAHLKVHRIRSIISFDMQHFNLIIFICKKIGIFFQKHKMGKIKEQCYQYWYSICHLQFFRLFCRKVGKKVARLWQNFKFNMQLPSPWNDFLKIKNTLILNLDTDDELEIRNKDIEVFILTQKKSPLCLFLK